MNMNHLAKSSAFENVVKSQQKNSSTWKKFAAADVTQAIGNVPIVQLRNICRVGVTSSRLAFPQETLAGVGIVKAVAVFLESPIIMILHASTALGSYAMSRRALWQFTVFAGLCLSGIFLILTWEPLYNWLLLDVFGVSPFIATQGFSLLRQFFGDNPTLVEAARPVVQILSCLPFLLALQNTFQGLLIHWAKNWFINLATLIAASFTLIVCGSLIFAGHSGATSAAYGMIAGIIGEILVLLFALQHRE